MARSISREAYSQSLALYRLRYSYSNYNIFENRRNNVDKSVLEKIKNSTSCIVNVNSKTGNLLVKDTSISRRDLHPMETIKFYSCDSNIFEYKRGIDDE